MKIDRRRLLQSLPSLVLASSAASSGSPLFAAKPPSRVALLVPLSGDHAALGRSIVRAASLAQADSDKGAFKVLDTGGTAQGAASAGVAARKFGAALVLGPVFEAEVPAVLAAVPRTVPVLSFSNSAALIESGAFAFGITARQAANAILRYAARTGLRRVAIGGKPDGWGLQARAAAAQIATELGIESFTLPGDGDTIPVSGATFDAVLMTDVASLARIATAGTGGAVKLLGMAPGLDVAPETIRALEGAAIAAIDPVRFAGFARSFEDRYGSAPGVITGLAYDAAGIVRQMRLGGGVDRSALLSANGFKGVCGDIRFREDGSVARTLAVLQVVDGKFRNLAAELAA